MNLYVNWTIASSKNLKQYCKQCGDTYFDPEVFVLKLHEKPILGTQIFLYTDALPIKKKLFFSEKEKIKLYTNRFNPGFSKNHIKSSISCVRKKFAFSYEVAKISFYTTNLSFFFVKIKCSIDGYFQLSKWLLN